MALPPTIPTSFVPHPASTAAGQRVGRGGLFGYIGYGALGLAVLMAIGVFIYSSVLTSEQSSSDAKLASAIGAIDPSTVTNFVHLRDRLSTGQALLAAHPAFSSFFTLLSTTLPTGVRFSDMHVSVGNAGVISLDATGVAKSFNVLAATSDAFAKDGRIKDAIFSGIKVEGNAVSFTLSATLDPSLVAFSAAPSAVPSALPAATSTAATSTSPTTP